MFTVGDLVRVTHPTGGVQSTDRFRVVRTPEDKSGALIWVVFEGEPRWVGDQWTRDKKPMGFHESALTKENV